MKQLKQIPMNKFHFPNNIKYQNFKGLVFDFWNLEFTTGGSL